MQEVIQAIHGFKSGVLEHGNRFTEETIDGLRNLGAALKRIHSRLLREGYTIENGKIKPPPEPKP